MKHRKSSRSAKKREERRERKKDPRDTPFPLPPTIEYDDMIFGDYEEPILSPDDLQLLLRLDPRTTCMMERERWA